MATWGHESHIRNITRQRDALLANLAAIAETADGAWDNEDLRIRRACDSSRGTEARDTFRAIGRMARAAIAKAEESA